MCSAFRSEVCEGIPAKMLGRVLCIFSTILLMQRVQCTGPPKIKGSYMAWGDMTQPNMDVLGDEMQISFEESYDADSQNSAFVFWMGGNNITFVQNYETNQTFQYIAGKDCSITDETEWVKSEYPPALLSYEDDDGRIKFSIRQLLNIPDRYLVENETEVPTIFRGIPARKWRYEIKGKNEEGDGNHFKIDAYWSDGTWNTTSTSESVLLAFIIEKASSERTNNETKVTVEEFVASVFGFVEGTYDRKHFLAFQGVTCPNRSQTLEFPAVQKIKAISIHSEMVLPDYQQINYIDTYFDPQNELLRVDLSRIRDEDPIAERKTKRYESEIAIGKIGLVFRQSVFNNSFSCEIIQFKDYLNDIQNFIDIKQDLAKWTTGKLFGLDNTDYVYIGKAMKADIPCHVFQGIRTDWPEESAKVTSLWEWCFNTNMEKENENVLFLNEEVGLINAQVTILSSGLPQDYPEGYRLFHHFYEVSPSDSDVLDATKFDISRCFKQDQRRDLQFYLQQEIADKDQILLAESLSSDISFLQKWKAAIYNSTGLLPYSLRISKLKATIADKKMYIKFLILEDYQSARDNSSRISTADAEKTLMENINNGNVAVTHPVKGKEDLVFKAEKNSLSLQINPNFDHHTLPPLPDTKTTSPLPGKEIIKYTGHKPGTVAAVSLATLFVGIFVGTTGVFYKFYGLPSCLRR